MKAQDIQAIQDFDTKKHHYLEIVGKGANQHLEVRKKSWFGRFLMMIECSQASLFNVVGYLQDHFDDSNGILDQKLKDKLWEKLEKGHRFPNQNLRDFFMNAEDRHFKNFSTKQPAELSLEDIFYVYDKGYDIDFLKKEITKASQIADLDQYQLAKDLRALSADKLNDALKKLPIFALYFLKDLSDVDPSIYNSADLYRLYLVKNLPNPFHQFSQAQVTSSLPLLDNLHIQILSPQQIKNLDTTLLKKQQAVDLFSDHANRKILSTKQLEPILHYLDLRLYPPTDEQMKVLSFSKLSPKQIEDFFDIPGDSNPIQKLSKAQLKEVVPHLKWFGLEKLSDQQIPLLDLTDLNPKQLDRLFQIPANALRIKLLTPGQLLSISNYIENRPLLKMIL